MSFKKVGSDQYSEKWESHVRLKSCYTTKMQCDTSGELLFTGEMEGDSSGNYYILFSGTISKQDVADYTGIIRVAKSDIDKITSSLVKTTCDFVYSGTLIPTLLEANIGSNFFLRKMNVARNNLWNNSYQ